MKNNFKMDMFWWCSFQVLISHLTKIPQWIWTIFTLDPKPVDHLETRMKLLKLKELLVSHNMHLILKIGKLDNSQISLYR